MECDVCKREVVRRADAVLMFAVASKDGADKFPAGWVAVAHRLGCQKMYEDLVFDGIVRVNASESVPLVERLSAFDGSGDKIVRMRQLYAFAEGDLRRLRSVDAWCVDAPQVVQGGAWRRVKDFVLSALSP